jgi:hypothetical protein
MTDSGNPGPDAPKDVVQPPASSSEPAKHAAADNTPQGDAGLADQSEVPTLPLVELRDRAMLVPSPDQPASASRTPEEHADQLPKEVPETPPRPTAEWKVLEPEDQTDPVAHEVFEHTELDRSWNILAASVRGKLHAHRAMWREDAYGHARVNDWTLVAVSDGAGSARLSRVGARIACVESLRTVKELLCDFRLRETGDSPSAADLMRIRTFLSEGARKAQLGLLREAQARGCAVRDLNCTFLMAIHCPWNALDFVAAIQIGDGAVGLFMNDDTCTLLGVADHGEYSSETRFLNTPYIEHEFDQRVLFSSKKGLRCLAVMCDGVSDDFFPEDKRLIELFIGNPINGLRTRTGEPVWGVMRGAAVNTGESLRDWLRYEKKGSSDDRTLVLMYRSDPS